MNKFVLLIVGPTAIGKTALSLQLARKIDCEIVSADSRQVYKQMNIGTAKPSREELAAVPHHFIDIKQPDEEYSAGQFGREARRCIDEIFARGKQPVVVGGSGLYIRGLVDGFFEPRVADQLVKKKLRQAAEENGIEPLYQRLAEIDPEAARQLHPTDTQRILRALEVFEITGKPWTKFLRMEPQPAPFEPVFIGLTLERKSLYERIERRVDAMLAQGLVDEVENLQKSGFGPELNALRTVGYQEVFQYLSGKLNHEEMAELIKQKTRNYAKRQLTWFRKDKRIRWFELESVENVAALAEVVGRLVVQ